MAYMQKYKIRDGARGWTLYEHDDGQWYELITVDSVEKAQAALKRVVSKEEYFYDENGEAV